MGTQRTPTLDDVSALIEGIYATIDDPAAWTAFLSALRDLTHSSDAVIQMLRPHIARAYECAQLVGRTRDVTGAMADRLDRHGTAAYLVGEDGAVRALNPTAERLLADRDPPLWLDASGRMRARGSACDRTLQQLLRGVLAADLPASGGTLVVDHLETPAVLVDVSPVAKRTVQSASRGALVFARELRAATAISEERLQLLYGLTAAEAGVARLLALGLALPAIADELGISRETVRTHIKRILAKTGTRRQAELCLLLAKSS